MPIDSTHPQYQKWQERWKRCRDAYLGEDAIKEANDAYLPILSSHHGPSDPKYLAYIMRAMFYGATARTVEGMTGLVMRKPAVIEVPAAMEEYLDDITGTGVGIQEFIKEALDQTLAIGRYGIQVDVDPDGERGYLVGRRAEDIRNWMTQDGDLTLVVFAEIEETSDPEDPYKIVETVIYRELYLGAPRNEEGEAIEGDPVLNMRLHRPDPAQKGKFIIEDLGVATRRAGDVDVVPFTFINTGSTSSEIVKPPLLDLVNVNISHYRNSADLEHGRHFTGLPTPFVTGIDPDENRTIEIGSESALVISDPAGKAGFMEFTGQGLSTLENALREKQEMMAVLGARILEVSKKAAETAETTRLNKSGDTSTMVAIASSVESAVKIALQQLAQWLGHDPEQVSVEINRDLLDSTIDPQMVAALLKLYQEGITSKETLYKQLQKGELLPDDFDPEEEMSRIEQAEPELQGDELNIEQQPRALRIVRDENGRSVGVEEVA